MKFRPVTEYNERNILPQKSCRKWGRGYFQTSLFFFFKRSFIWGRSKCSTTYFQYISTVLNLTYNKNKLFKTLDYWSSDMLNLDFGEKGLGMVPPPHFAYDFSRQIFLMLCFIKWPSFMNYLPLLLEVLVNMCIAIVC